MIKVIVAIILMIILTGCMTGEHVSPEAIEAVAETCKEQDKQVRVFQTRSTVRIYCE